MQEHEDDIEERPRETRPRRRRRIGAGIVAAVGLVVLGAIGGAVLSERRHAEQGHLAQPATAAAGATPTNEPLEVTLAPEAMQRAGITIAAVTTAATAGTLAVPGTVTSNAYRDTKVNALVGGIVRQVMAVLGSTVDRAQPLAIISSSELADAQTRYLSMRAMLDADHQKLERARRLADLGAVSRQDLEEVTATHDAHETELAGARQRLLLLGLSAERVDKLETASPVVSEVIVTSPASGVIVMRSVNPGQVVGAAQELFVVTDLTSVWIIGDLYEKDFGSVRVGTTATVTVPSLPNAPLRGRVAYVDPRVDPATRTAKVRVEVPNRDGVLKLGMFVEATFATGTGARRTVVPRAAVQSINSRSVAYVATEGEGRFVERLVQLGIVMGDAVEVVDGLKAGERVVADGSFYLRAEAARVRGGG